MVRSVGKSNALPVGAFGANASGLDIGFAREDHLHGFWEEPEELVYNPPFTDQSASVPLVIMRSGPLRTLSGAFTSPGGTSLVTTLPVGDRGPKYMLFPVHVSPIFLACLWCNPTNGEVHVIDNSLAFYTGAVNFSRVSNMIWRVDK